MFLGVLTSKLLSSRASSQGGVSWLFYFHSPFPEWKPRMFPSVSSVCFCFFPGDMGSNISLEAVTKATYLCRFWVCVCVWWILMALWMGLTADTPKTCTLQRPSDTYGGSCVPWSVPIVDTVPACSRYSVIICWMNTQDLTYYICTVQYSSHQPTWWFKLRCAVSNGHWILRLNAKKIVKKSS